MAKVNDSKSTSNPNPNRNPATPNLADQPPPASNQAPPATIGLDVTADGLNGTVNTLLGPTVPPLVSSPPANDKPLTPPIFPPVSQETPRVPAARQGDAGRPFCETHQCLMRASGTRDDVTNYTCPVPKCTCTAKRARPQVRISRDPQRCPGTLCSKPQQYLALVPAKSNHAICHMECPQCGFGMKVPRPQFAEMVHLQSKRPPNENFSDR